MDAFTATASTCNTEQGCITCGDTAVALRVVGSSAAADIFVCENAEGLKEEVDTGIVDAVAVGDLLLVHAGVALARLERKRGP